MPYRPGELTERVTLQTKSRAEDGMGGFVEAWVDTATVWALVRPMSGKERAWGEQQQASANYLVVIRYRSGLHEQQRIVWRGTSLNIRFIKDRGPRALYLEIEAEAGVES